MREVRMVEMLVRFGRHDPEPGGWRVLLLDRGVVVRDYPCRDQRHAEALAEALRREYRLPALSPIQQGLEAAG
jgi:hypothetical protein